MLFNDIFLLELIIIINLVFYLYSTNLIILLYTGGIYLILVGLLALINDADIYIGFLWVIDLGVGLVFFIFILHFTSFLFQKSQFNLSWRYFFFSILLVNFYLVFTYYWGSKIDNNLYNDLGKNWFFHTTYLDYYQILFTNEVTDLNTLRDSYFLLNSFEFFSINFSLFFGLVAAILMCFIIQRIFNYLNFSQIISINSLNLVNSAFFLRNQNFINQQNTPVMVRSWIKNKKVI